MSDTTLIDGISNALASLAIFLPRTLQGVWKEVPTEIRVEALSGALWEACLFLREDPHYPERRHIATDAVVALVKLSEGDSDVLCEALLYGSSYSDASELFLDHILQLRDAAFMVPSILGILEKRSSRLTPAPADIVCAAARIEDWTILRAVLEFTPYMHNWCNTADQYGNMPLMIWLATVRDSSDSHREFSLIHGLNALVERGRLDLRSPLYTSVETGGLVTALVAAEEMLYLWETPLTDEGLSRIRRFLTPR